MDDLQFYLVNDFCSQCNTITSHDAFELKESKDEQAVLDPIKTEHVCGHCHSVN
ncbi:hypothetical protein [Vibrio hangzhouensis]|uniref:Uncharacterized protein n=1 Tax=Vibrio hangzhouensis TaxID=462991 RepID=A0A1H5WRB5_9VIBR|nr:hypothetical protein [Vibrio hangzhouensis]MBY6198043.1 hypothetical protein [Vibrio hangzhouensis]SEG01880.1 hypothetical protein SAMN04488244_10632 [Vibrio hangzhouensis]